MASMMDDDEEWSIITATVAAGVMIATPLSLGRTTSGGSESDGVLVTPIASPKKPSSATAFAAAPPTTPAAAVESKDDVDEKKGPANKTTVYMFGGQTVPSPTIPTCVSTSSRLVAGKLESLTAVPGVVSAASAAGATGAPRFRCSTSRVGEYIYVIGGHTNFDANTPALASVERFHIPSQKWSSVAPLPRPRCDHASVVIDNQIYVLGGSPATESTSMVIYNTETNEWKDGEPMIMPRSMHCCAVSEKKVYVFGGFAVPKKGRPAPVPAHVALGGGNPNSNIGNVPCEVYDCATGLWTEIGSMPSTSYRFHAATVVVDQKILLLGGSAPIAAVDTVLEYTPASDTWRQLRWVLPQPRSGFAAWFESDTRSLYIAAGQPWSKCSNVYVRTPVETGQWLKVTDIPALSEFGTCI